jgi:parallel beta-helix repeat protein
MINPATTVSAVSASHRRSSRASRRLLGAALAAGLLICVTGAQAPVAAAETAPVTCNKVASPTGSDTASGTLSAPYRTAQALANSLQPGQVGCLRAGTYAGGIRFGHGGGAGSPLVVRSYPGETALVTGRVYVPRGSDYVTVADLNLNSAGQSEGPLPSPTIDSNNATFEGDDVTNEHTGICFALGSEGWGVANNTTIADDHIHDCGLMPAANHDHGIYVDDAVNTHIVGNLIDHNADRGIQLYPSSTDALITNNVISENGEGIIFSGEGGVSSSGNVVEHNLVVNSLVRQDIESWYPAGTPVGVGNVVRDNCVSSRGINTSAGGFTATGNVTARASELVATSEGGYRPASGSTCAGVVSATTTVGTEANGEAPSEGGSAPGGNEVGGETSSPAPEAPAGTAPTGTSTGTPTAGGSGGKTPTATPSAPHGGKHHQVSRRRGRNVRHRLDTRTHSELTRAFAARRHHRHGHAS